MAAIKEIVILLLVVVLSLVASAPTPGGHSKHEKYIIHVPVKYHTIHHVKIQKVPIYIKKHIHHHKYEEEHHEPQVHEEEHEGYDRYDEGDDNQSFGSYEGSNEYHH